MPSACANSRGMTRKRSVDLLIDTLGNAAFHRKEDVDLHNHIGSADVIAKIDTPGFPRLSR